MRGSSEYEGKLRSSSRNERQFLAVANTKENTVPQFGDTKEFKVPRTTLSSERREQAYFN